MKDIFVYVLEFMLTLDKMPNISKKFEIYGQSILKVIQAFNNVRIVLYSGCSDPVIGSSCMQSLGLKSVRICRGLYLLYLSQHMWF